MRQYFMLVLFNQDAFSEFHRLVRITQLLNQLQLQITKKMKKTHLEVKTVQS